MQMRRLKRIITSIMCILLCFNLLMTDFVVRAEESDVNIETSDASLNNATVTSVKIDESTFPDDNFRQYIVDNIDNSGDGILSVDEIKAVTKINNLPSNITDLSGIHILEYVEVLDLSYDHNKIRSIDLSNCQNLKKLYCNFNENESLNVSNCKNLEIIECHNNTLKIINLSGCKNLKTLICYGNELKIIDISDCNELTCLDCSANELTNLDLCKCNLVTLHCSDNLLSTLDLSKCTNLLELNCCRNQLNELNVNDNVKLRDLRCEENSISVLDVHYCTELLTLMCSRNEMDSLNVKNCSKLQDIICWKNKINYLDLTTNVRLSYLSCIDNELTSLDLSKNKNLGIIECYDNKFSILDLSKCRRDVQYSCDDNVTVITRADKVCTTTVEKFTKENTYNFIVLDKDTGKPVTNVKWAVSDYFEPQYYNDTGSEASFSFEVKDNLFGGSSGLIGGNNSNISFYSGNLIVKADGYINSRTPIRFYKGTSKAIPIYLTPRTNDLDIEELNVYSIDSAGNKTGKENVMSTFKKWINILDTKTVEVNAVGIIDIDGTVDLKYFELAQTKYNNSQIAKEYIIGKYDISKSHSIDISKFKEDEPIYVRGLDAKGNKSKWKLTNLKIVKGSKEKLPIVEIGEDIEFEIPKEVPILGNSTFKIEAWDDLPVSYSVNEDDGTFKVGINVFSYEDSLKLINEDKIDTTKTNTVFDDKEWQKLKDVINNKNEKEIADFQEKRNSDLLKQGMKVANTTVDVDIWGYLEGNVGDKIVTGKIVICFEGSHKRTVPYHIGSVPMVFIIDVGGSIEGELNSTYHFALNKCNLGGAVTATLDLSFGTGPGFGDLAYLTINGDGKITSTIELDSKKESNLKPHIVSDLVVGVSVTAKFLFWESSKVLTEKTYRLTEYGTPSSNGVSLNNFSLTNEDSYVLDINNNSVSFNTTDYSNVPAFENETVLENSANDDTKVFLENIGDTKMLLYTVKDPTRSEINQNKLVYSLYDNESNTWSEAKAILDDGTADFYPYVISDGTDVYLSWVNLNAEMDADTVTMVSSAAATEVVLAKYNAETDSFDTIYQTNNDMMDYAPTLGFTPDGVAMSWINNSNNNLFCNDDNNDIMVVNYKQSTIDTPKLVKEDCSNVMSVTPGKLGNQSLVAVETDKDADYLTTDDRILTLYDTTGNVVKTIAGGDAISDAEFINFDGKDIFVWHQDNTLYCIDSIDGTANYFIHEDAVVANGYTITESSDKAFVTFLSVSENDCNVLSTYIYDKENDAWGEQICLSNVEANINMFDVISDNDGIETIYTDGSLKYSDFTLKQDIAFDDISYDDYVVTEDGNKLDIIATITNSGQKTVSGVNVKISNSLGELVDSRSVDIKIPAGKTVDADVQFTMPNTIGSAETYYVEISTVSGNEVSMDNNKQEISIGYTNLDLENLEATSFGNINTCTVYVKNNGPIATTGTAYLRHETEDGEAIKIIDIESLEPGESACVTIQINTDYVDWEGTHSLYYITLESDGVEKDTLMNSQTFYALKLACTDSEDVFTITSINEPEDVIFDNGTSVDDIITELPKYITVTTDKGDIDVEVSWNVDELSNGGYDPSLLTKQELSVTGNMIIPDSINAGELGTSVVLNVIVDSDKSIQSITFDKSVIELEVGKSDTIDITTIPDDGDINTILWSSSDEKVVKVDSTGKITAIKEGNAIITASVGDNSEISASCTVTVTAPTTEEPKPDQPKTYPTINTSYRTHIQSFGWEGNADDIKTWKSNGTMSGTSGKAKRLEGINIVVNSAETGKDVDLGIQYTTHCQSYGWLPWSADGDMNGTEGEAKRLEAIKIQLTGADKDAYDVYYRVHAQSYGWLNWAKNGAPSGTAGYGKRLEGIQIVVVKKGEAFNQKMEGITSVRTESYIAKEGSSPIVNYAPTSNTNPVIPGADTPNVAYRTHVQSFGWQGWKYNGQMSGTSGLAKRLEGININLTNKPCDGDIVYTTHVQTYGWKDGKPEDTTRASWKKNGAMSGTSGEAKRLEAICIDLTGEMGEKYDIYYRVHAQSFGWLGWAKNGEESGTAGYGKRLEGIQIVLVPKGGKAPATDYGGVKSVRTEGYIAK